MDRIKESIRQSMAVKEQILSDPSLIEAIGDIAACCSQCLCDGHKVLFCGNGGSAADAQHLAAELSGRFYFDRPALAAESLTVNTSFLTAVANDYSFEDVFSRMVESLGQEGDVLFGLSTSGNSENVVRAFQAAHKKGMITVAFTGAGGGKLAALADYIVKVPSSDTPRIQEAHILLGHIVCETIETNLFPR